jgi:glycosyltransferase involved in cell wall biosynthesis
VIVSDIGAAPETILTGQQDFTGWVVPCRDAAAIAERVVAALALSPEERATLGTRARRHVTVKFTLAEMQQTTLEVYDELLGTHLAARFAAFNSPLPA